MADALRLRAALAGAALLAVWPGGGPQGSLAATAPGAFPAVPPSSAPAPEYTTAGHALRLVTTDGTCVVEHRGSGGEPGRITLDLRPPCYLLTWQRPPPSAEAHSAEGSSGGIPVGDVGEPMAWRYADMKGVTTLAVIGDPMPDNLRASNLYQLREQQGLHCGASMQAILLRTDSARASRKRENVGVFCAELGLDEKDFWMLAHP